MNHDEMKDLIFQYHDGALSGPGRLAAEKHLADCGDCRESLAQWRRAAGLFFAPVRPQPSETFVRAVMEKVHAQKTARGGLFQIWEFWRRARESFSFAHWGMAGAAALAVLAVVFLRAPHKQGPVIEPAAAASYVSEEVIGTLASANDSEADYGTSIEEYFL